MNYGKYFASLGYKYVSAQSKFIIKDFQRHAGISADGIIGPITKGKINHYNYSNFCPEVFESIKPYVNYNDVEIEALMQQNLEGLGAVFNRCAKDNNFDVLHSIGHSVLEASKKGLWANSAIAKKKNNIYGFGAYDLSPMASAKKFSSFAECIQIWSTWLNENYLQPWGKYYHGNCEKGINYKYASSGIAGINKSFIVRDLRRKLYGKHYFE